MNMEKLMTEPLTESKILVWEDKKTIEQKRSELLQAVALLENIRDVLPFENANTLPANVDDFILDLATKKDKALKDLLRLQRHLSIDDVNISPELQALRQYLHQWLRLKSDFILKYIKFNGTEFIADLQKLDESFDNDSNVRKYLTTPEQLKRFEIATTYIQWITKDLAIPLGIERAVYAQLPFTSWKGFGDENSLYPDVNLNFVLTK